MDVKPLLRKIFRQLFGEPTSLLDCLIKQDIQAPSGGGGDQLVAFVSKMYPTGDGTSFDALARIYAGTIQQGPNGDHH